MNTIEIKNAAVYVGTYAKYNQGSLFGKWLTLSDFQTLTEFYEACTDLHHDEMDPEFMFQDFENIPNSLISESWISEKIFDILESLNNLDEDLIEPFLIWSDNGHLNFHDEDIEDLISSFENEFIGKYDSEEDYAREIIEEREDLSDFVKLYFDYESYADDLFSGDYWSFDGYIFHSC